MSLLFQGDRASAGLSVSLVTTGVRRDQCHGVRPDPSTPHGIHLWYRSDSAGMAGTFYTFCLQVA